MKRIVPFKNTVVCRKIEENNEKKTGNVLLVSKPTVETYEILDYSADKDQNFTFKTGDIILVSGKGDEIEVENSTVYLFKTENVIAKINN